jgi:hypothetical protein
MKSQQLMWQSRAPELSISSKQQPGSLPRMRPVTVEAGIVAVVLTAVGFALVLAYGAASAAIARNGYAEMQLRQEIEELRARTALLRYQNDLVASSARVQQTAERLGLVMGDPVGAVDYVSLPSSAQAQVTQLALAPADEGAGLSSVVSQLTSGVSTGGRAEASTEMSHRP